MTLAGLLLAGASADSLDTPWAEVPALLLPAYGQTWAMVGATIVLVVVIGTPLGVIVHNTSPLGLHPRPAVFAVLDTVVNIGRSLPFLILMAAIIPFTRLIVGTTIGIPGAIVPMTIGGIPFFVRLVQNALREVRGDVIDMGRVSGGSYFQVVRSVQLSEGLPALVAATTVTMVGMIEYSAIAGAIGAGGVGHLAITYGYNRFDDNIMIATVVTLIVTIQAVQWLGDFVVRRVTR